MGPRDDDFDAPGPRLNWRQPGAQAERDAGVSDDELDAERRAELVEWRAWRKAVKRHGQTDMFPEREPVEPAPAQGDLFRGDR